MEFLALQNAVLGRFETADRPNVKLWLNLFAATLYESERWSFRYATDDVQTAAGSVDVTGEAADMGVVLDAWNADGDELQPMTVTDFYRRYQPMVVNADSGTPEAFTVHGGQLKIGPPADAVATVSALYLRRWTDLSTDTDDPLTINGLPRSLHWLLVAGAMAIGQANAQDPTAALAEPVINQGVEMMRREYLSDVQAREQWGAYPWP
jgi:hypothetical protein